MAMILGVNCDNQNVYLALAEDGRIQPDPDKLSVPGGLESHSRLWAIFDDITRLLKQLKPQGVVILTPEAQYSAGHSQFTPRIALETVIRMSCTKLKIPVEMISRQKVRSRLELPKKGSLDDYLKEAVGEAVGKYWNSGRGLAAMAALASATRIDD